MPVIRACPDAIGFTATASASLDGAHNSWGPRIRSRGLWSGKLGPYPTTMASRCRIECHFSRSPRTHGRPRERRERLRARARRAHLCRSAGLRHAPM